MILLPTVIVKTKPGRVGKRPLVGPPFTRRLIEVKQDGVVTESQVGWANILWFAHRLPRQPMGMVGQPTSDAPSSFLILKPD